MRVFVMAIGLVALMGVVGAQQVEEIESYEMFFFATGASAATSSYPFTLAERVCNLDPLPPGGTSTNPRLFRWDDPDNAGKQCEHVPGTGSALFALPVGNYVGRLYALGATLTSDASNDANFDVEGAAPGAPSGLQFRR